MSKDKKSMDDVLASIRRIIKTDPNAVPPDASSIPPGVGADETAEAVLKKLQTEEQDLLGKPLSKSDDPDETARAVLEELRKQSEREQKGQQQAAKPAETPPDLERPLKEPPKVDSDEEGVPEIEAQEAGAADAAEGEIVEPEEAGHESVPEKIEPRRPAATTDAPTMVDEAALEAMIRRVVRDELMGEMGKRMTKNVQKLIRQEVAKSRLENK